MRKTGRYQYLLACLSHENFGTRQCASRKLSTRNPEPFCVTGISLGLPDQAPVEEVSVELYRPASLEQVRQGTNYFAIVEILCKISGAVCSYTVELL